jgi:type II secretory pathway pseudopilin PulG
MNNEHGYTLAELLTGMAVTGLLLAGLLLTLQGGRDVYQSDAARAEVQQNARVALERMLRELRAATTVTTATATDVKFTYFDATGTNDIVEYSLNGVQLQRNQTGAAGQPEALIGGVRSLVITYYDINGVVTTTAANVRTVDIQLTTQPENPTVAPSNVRTAVVQGRVRVRNE